MFDGVVLCGGASRRMGRDKATLVVEGEPMAVRVARALEAAGALDVYAVGGDRPALTAAGLHVIPDREPGTGPLGGLLTSLAATGRCDAVAVLSCDLLRPDPDLIAQLADRRRLIDADVIVPVDRGRDQWLHAVWHRRCLEPLRARLLDGERSVADAAMAAVDVHRQPVRLPGSTDDADRVEDLEALEGD